MGCLKIEDDLLTWHAIYQHERDRAYIYIYIQFSTGTCIKRKLQETDLNAARVRRKIKHVNLKNGKRVIRKTCQRAAHCVQVLDRLKKNRVIVVSFRVKWVQGTVYDLCTFWFHLLAGWEIFFIFFSIRASLFSSAFWHTHTHNTFSGIQHCTVCSRSALSLRILRQCVPVRKAERPGAVIERKQCWGARTSLSLEFLFAHSFVIQRGKARRRNWAPSLLNTPGHSTVSGLHILKKWKNFCFSAHHIWSKPPHILHTYIFLGCTNPIASLIALSKRCAWMN